MFGLSALDQRHAYVDGIQRIPRALARLEVPLIAAVNGAAIGAGCDLAMMCDIRIASERASFAESFVQLGLIPGDGGTWFLPRASAIERAAEMTFTGDRVDARPRWNGAWSAAWCRTTTCSPRRTRARRAHREEPPARAADGQAPAAGVAHRFARVDAGHGRGHATAGAPRPRTRAAHREVADELMALHRLVPPASIEAAATAPCAPRCAMFLADQLAAGAFTPSVDAWLSGWDEKFTAALAARGWLGMTVPSSTAGTDARSWSGSWSPRNCWPPVRRSPRTGSPTVRSCRHCSSTAPRQQKQQFLPRIVRGECFFAHRHERARFRLRPGQRAHPGRARRRRLVAVRHEGLDLRRSSRARVHRLGPHRAGGSGSTGTPG